MGQMRTQLNIGSFLRDKKSCCLKILTSSVPSRLSNRTVSAPVCLVHDIDHERLRFLTDQPRKSRTGNLAVGRPDYHVGIVPGLRVRSNTGIRSSSVVLRKHCCARYFVSLFISLGWEESHARFRLSC